MYFLLNVAYGNISLNSPESNVNSYIRWDTFKFYLRGGIVACYQNKIKQTTRYRKNLQNLLQNTEN